MSGEIRDNITSNAVGSKNTEAGVYKNEAFMPAGVNKSDHIISIIFFLVICIIAGSASGEAIS